MNQLQLHPTTETSLQALGKELPHALLLSGKPGVGLKTIANQFVKEQKATALLIEPDEKGTIKIDTIRQLYRQTSVKKSTHLFVIIDDAEALGVPAQNAFLKLLEEPTDQTTFLLTSHHPQLLLETVRSRLQEVVVLPITSKQTDRFINENQKTDAQTKAKLLFMANGLPAELTRLLQSETYFSEKSDQIRQARQFISSQSYERLLIANNLATDRQAALELIRAAALIVRTSLKTAPSPALTQLLRQIINCEEKLLADGNVRVQLLKLAIG